MSEDPGMEIRKSEKYTVDYRGIAHDFETEAEAKAFIYGAECAANLPPRWKVKEMIDGMPVWEEQPKPEGTPASMPTGEMVKKILTDAGTKPEESYSEFVREVNTATDAAIAKAVPSMAEKSGLSHFPHLAGIGNNNARYTPPETD